MRRISAVTGSMLNLGSSDVRSRYETFPFESESASAAVHTYNTFALAPEGKFSGTDKTTRGTANSGALSLTSVTSTMTCEEKSSLPSFDDALMLITTRGLASWSSLASDLKIPDVGLTEK